MEDVGSAAIVSNGMRLHERLLCEFVQPTQGQRQPFFRVHAIRITMLSRCAGRWADRRLVSCKKRLYKPRITHAALASPRQWAEQPSGASNEALHGRGGSTGEDLCLCLTFRCVSCWKLACISATKPTAGT